MTKLADQMAAVQEKERDQSILHQRMEWFFKKYAPADRYEAAEFQADLMLLVQAVHHDASRETHALLKHALRLMPNPFPIMQTEPKK